MINPRHNDSPTTSRRSFARHVAGGAAVAWVAPSVLSLDRVGAATPSGFVLFEYDEDFQGTIGNPDVTWTSVSTDTAPADPSRRFLGQFASNDAVTVTATLPAHTVVSLAFDLYIIRSWDGSVGAKYNDRFRVQVDGVTVFNESFAQAWLVCCGRGQTYGPAPINPPGTGAVETSTLGYYWGSNPADTVYRIEFPAIPHTDGTVNVNLTGLNLQGLNDEAWGIDNLRITAC